MTGSTSITTLGAQLALGMADADLLATLDRRTRREVELVAAKMTKHATIQMHAMDAVSAIHIHTTHKIDTTLGAAEFLKALRAPAINTPELRQRDAIALARYLEAAHFISTDAIRKVLAELE